MTFSLTYLFNLNVRDKFFGYYPARNDRFAHVGTIEVEAGSILEALEIAFDRFNRHGEPTPELDRAEAPSLSVGDVVYLVGPNDEGYYACASAGWDRLDTAPITVPGRVRDLLDAR